MKIKSDRLHLEMENVKQPNQWLLRW